MTGKALRILRRRIGLSQAGLAREVGVHANSIARMERDEIGMRESTERLIRRIADERGAKR